MGKKKVKKKNTVNRLSITGIFTALVVLAILVNFLFQVSQKPTELLSLVLQNQTKNPSRTWEAYSDLFIQHSTEIMTADFLAALAQVESAGNAFTSPEWKFNTNASLFDFYKPASSSVGLMQFTEGTFEKASKYCIHNNQVRQVGSWFDFESCWFNWANTRLSASDSIEVTSAYLHAAVEKLLKNKRRKASRKTKQTLAAAIHLCGFNKVKRSLRQNSLKIKGCGSHSLKRYVSKLKKYQLTFSRYLVRDISQGKSIAYR